MIIKELTVQCDLCGNTFKPDKLSENSDGEIVYQPFGDIHLYPESRGECFIYDLCLPCARNIDAFIHEQVIP